MGESGESKEEWKWIPRPVSLYEGNCVTVMTRGAKFLLRYHITSGRRSS